METIGGQAVMEGVMIKGPKAYAIAVRKPNGKINVKKVKHVSWTKRNWLASLPFVRGIMVFFESMVIGVKALNHSASIAGKGEGIELSTTHLVLTMVAAIVFALLLFKALPLAIAQLLNYMLPYFKNRFMFNFTEGVVKAAILFGYILLIGRMKDVKRLFEYHGAEHKVVNCYEASKKLAMKNIKRYSTIHPRCGGSFLILVVVVSVLFYILIPLDMGYLAKLGVRLLFLPVIAAVAYEIIRISSRYPDFFFSKILIWPGSLVQRITTSEPDKKQIDVAVAALKKII